jgi:hypothetical protein
MVSFLILPTDKYFSLPTMESVNVEASNKKPEARRLGSEGFWLPDFLLLAFGLLTETEFGDDFLIAFAVGLDEVFQEAVAAADHF